MGRRSRPYAGALLRLGVAACLAFPAAFAAEPVHAEKLVVFKHGKVIRVKDIETDRGWTRLLLDGGAILGVRSSQIAKVEDASGGWVGKLDAGKNQTTLGGGRAAGRYRTPPNQHSVPRPPPTQRRIQRDGDVNKTQPSGRVRAGDANTPIPGLRSLGTQPAPGLGGRFRQGSRSIREQDEPAGRSQGAEGDE